MLCVTLAACVRVEPCDAERMGCGCEEAALVGVLNSLPLLQPFPRLQHMPTLHLP